MYKAIIVDDEPMGVETLRVLLEKYTPEIQVSGTTTEPRHGIELIEKTRPDIVFLDISMPEMNGFHLLEQLSFTDFKIVFTTAHVEYALQAIKNKAFDYLLKPISIDELKECVKKLVDEHPKIQIPYPAYLELSVRDGIIFVKPSDIIRLEASGSYTVFHLEGGIKHTVSKNLKEYELLLNPEQFFRCHSSHLIHLGKVVKLLSKDGLNIQMNDGSMPQLSKRSKELFLDKLKRLT